MTVISKRKPGYIIPVAVLLSVAISGCSTVTRGTHEELRVDTLPPGATVTVEQVNKNKAGFETRECEPTPCAINLPRKRGGRVTVSKDGYQPITFEFISTTRGSKSLIAPGAIVAGAAPGSFVTVGESKWIDSLSGGQLAWGDGSLAPVAKAMGAYNSLSPNPVIVTLAKEADPNQTPMDNSAEETSE